MLGFSEIKNPNKKIHNNAANDCTRINDSFFKSIINHVINAIIKHTIITLKFILLLQLNLI